MSVRHWASMPVTSTLQSCLLRNGDVCLLGSHWQSTHSVTLGMRMCWQKLGAGDINSWCCNKTDSSFYHQLNCFLTFSIKFFPCNISEKSSQTIPNQRGHLHLSCFILSSKWYWVQINLRGSYQFIFFISLSIQLPSQYCWFIYCEIIDELFQVHNFINIADHWFITADWPQQLGRCVWNRTWVKSRCETWQMQRERARQGPNSERARQREGNFENASVTWGKNLKDALQS